MYIIKFIINDAIVYYLCNAMGFPTQVLTARHVNARVTSILALAHPFNGQFPLLYMRLYIT